MNYFTHAATVDFFEPVLTGYDLAAGNSTAAPSMIFGSSIAYAESGVSGRRKRNAWSKEEDAILLDTVRTQPGAKKDWSLVAVRVNQNSDNAPRTGKQCRERWQNHLRPNIKKGNWTRQEEELIRVMFESYGPKWSSMSKLMKTRTDNDIKNKWYSMQRTKRARKRKVTQQRKEKRFMKSRLNERQEILDLISSSKTGQPPLGCAQDENQAIAANETQFDDDLQPFPTLHQDTFEVEDVTEFLDIIAAATSEV